MKSDQTKEHNFTIPITWPLPTSRKEDSSNDKKNHLKHTTITIFRFMKITSDEAVKQKIIEPPNLSNAFALLFGCCFRIVVALAV